MKPLFWIVFLFMLAACTGEGRPGPTATTAPSSTPSAAASPAFSLEQRQALENTLEALHQLHQQIGPVWEGLARGESAQCGQEFARVPPESIAPTEAHLIELRRAAIELENAVLLWQAECQNPRSTIPAELLNRGVLMVTTAADHLQSVEEILKTQ